MAYLLGIDLGTSSVKTILMDIDGNIVSIGQVEYSFDIPTEGWAEQDVQVWWEATVCSIQMALKASTVESSQIAGIGFSGQMHGLVALDRNHKPLRKAIIWCDHRTKDQVERITRTIGTENLGRIIHSPVATGFLLPSLLWMKENEPDLYERTGTVLLPKDYIRFRLTGEISTDVTDAAGTAAFDCSSATWSAEILDALRLDKKFFPPVHVPDSYAGSIHSEAARETGLAAGTKVYHGGADQAMQALGNGIIEPGIVSLNIGTGGQIFMPLASSVYDPKLRSHCFNFVTPGSWYFMGAVLSAGLSLKWTKSVIAPGEEYRLLDEQVARVPCGSEGLVFLPYLSGERTPHMNPDARALFFGLTLNHGRYHMLRAVMEGVVFGLRDCRTILTDDLRQECRLIVASGGGARSSVWLQMQADIMDSDIFTSTMKEQAAVGAAITAGVGAGFYGSYAGAVEKVVAWNDQPVSPRPDNVRLYDDYYEVYKELYDRTKDLMSVCGRLSGSGR